MMIKMLIKMQVKMRDSQSRSANAAFFEKLI